MSDKNQMKTKALRCEAGNCRCFTLRLDLNSEMSSILSGDHWNVSARVGRCSLSLPSITGNYYGRCWDSYHKKCVVWCSQNQSVCSCVKHLTCADKWDVHSYIWTMTSHWVYPVETLHFNEPVLKLALHHSYNRSTRQHLLSLMGNFMTKTCQRWSRTQVNHQRFDSHILYSISLDLRLFTLHNITRVTTWR